MVSFPPLPSTDPLSPAQTSDEGSIIHIVMDNLPLSVLSAVSSLYRAFPRMAIAFKHEI